MRCGAKELHTVSEPNCRFKNSNLRNPDAQTRCHTTYYTVKFSFSIENWLSYMLILLSIRK
jgi:hypothetical protein